MEEERIVLSNCRVIDPRDASAYIARDGFKALEKALKQMEPQQVVEEVKKSGLRGRGGAGFPTGLKWELASKSAGEERFLICNAAEGEVGTFKDRYIIQGDPLAIIEGMAIAGYAIGAKQGYIYLRAEYRYLRDLLENAIKQAGDYWGKINGALLNIEVREASGNYVCGEESALMESVEGKRGSPRYRPPFPTQRGLWETPTVINNVETLANVPRIIGNGGEWFSQIGTEQSKGTKVFSVSGDVEKPGVYEASMGISLKRLLEELAEARDVKAALVGGAAGNLVPAERLDIPLAFETVMGSGAIIVFSRDRDMVEMAWENMKFFAEESCGKCIPCRLGTQVSCEILKGIYEGQGQEKDLRTLSKFAGDMKVASLCGLGQAASTCLLDSLEYFRHEYERHFKA